ncbi:MAG: WD40 repeat domain-containing protein [Actinomycetota bacterium]
MTIVRSPRQPQATTSMREFVRAGRTEATRRQRRTATVSIAVAVVSATLAAVAFLQFQRANSERERAEEQLALASSRALAAQAIQLQEFGDDETGLLLAAESATRAPTAEARDALLGLLPDDEIVSLRSTERPDSAVDRVVSSDGRFEVSNDGRTLRDLESGSEQTLIEDERELAVFLRDVTFSPDASRLALTNLTEFRFEVYDLSDGLPAARVFTADAPPNEQVVGAAFDDSNELIGVSVTADGADDLDLTMSIWDEVGTLILDAFVEESLDEDFDLSEASVRISADGSELGALVSQWGEAQLFSPRSGQLIGFLLPAECSPSCGSDVTDARVTNAFQDSTTLETIDRDGTARSFDLDLDRWIGLACDSTDRRLTEQQWERFVGEDVTYDPVC